MSSDTNKDVVTNKIARELANLPIAKRRAFSIALLDGDHCGIVLMSAILSLNDIGLTISADAVVLRKRIHRQLYLEHRRLDPVRASILFDLKIAGKVGLLRWSVDSTGRDAVHTAGQKLRNAYRDVT